jgi:nitroreductase
MERRVCVNVLEAIQNRREITSFSSEKIPEETVERIVEAAYLAPSGNNLPSREFVLTVKREKLDALVKATPFVPWLAEATAAIVVTGRPEVSKYWLQDASIACGFAWLEAVESGLGAAFGAVYHSEDRVESEERESIVRQQLSIPDDRRIVAILGLGFQDAEPKPKKLLLRDEIVNYEKFYK